jgi:hypothetical protein
MFFLLFFCTSHQGKFTLFNREVKMNWAVTKLPDMHSRCDRDNFTFTFAFTHLGRRKLIAIAKKFRMEINTVSEKEPKSLCFLLS